MKRFILVVLLLINGWLLSSSEAFALEERLIAVIMANSQPRYQAIQAVFEEKIQSACESDCRIYVQTPNADTMSLRNSVRKAVALGAELIVTYGPAASLAALAETPPIPTVFADVYDPIGLDLISADKNVGRNMTGIRGDAPIQALLKYFLESTQAESLAVLFDAGSPEANLQKTVLEKQGQKKGVAVTLLPVVNPKDHAGPLQALPEHVDGLFLASSEHTETHLAQAIKFADERQIPVITQRAGAAAAGAFMVLETSAVEQGEKVAEMAKAVLAGKSTDDIPMQRPHKVEFVVNLKVAKRYSLTVPFKTLSVASRIVR